MRILFIILLNIFFISEIKAQSLSTEGEVVNLVGNAYASRHRRSDAKGQLCGVLFVRSTIKDLDFFGDIVGDIKFDAGVYYVYLRPKTSKLKISDSNGASIRLILPKIEPLTTYEVVVYQPEERGYLQCASDPSGATVTLISKDQRIEIGRTPLRSNVKVLTGIYNIEVSKKGYSTKVINNVKIKRDKTTKIGTIKLNTL